MAELKDKLRADLTGAMKSQDKLRTATLRMVLAAIQSEEVSGKQPRELSDADVVICSSSGWAHGVTTRGRKVVYCYSPARWLYQTQRYLGTRNRRVSRRAGAAVLRASRSLLQDWDRRAAASADGYMVMTRAKQDEVKRLYGLTASIVPPPAADLTGLVPSPPADIAGGLIAFHGQAEPTLASCVIDGTTRRRCLLV